MQDEEVLAALGASAGRRILGVGSVAGLGLTLLYLALVQSPSLGWQVFMVGFGGTCVFLAERMWRATAQWLVLTRDGLRDNTGRMIAPAAQIRSVDRGVFAFKPSNGFRILLTEKAPAVWQPGLWWRVGRSVGVGGVTAGTPAKYMAEQIQELITRQSQD
ncbi:conserved hypothetical protein [Roseovarius sp. EC-HK134]|jgi:hypothetical protein|uniref:PH domain-containing protein n=1 Tax=Roseovarius mucosus TaxID=215743 RepID=A0A1V0RKZ8_9RHOB|nr:MULTISPECIES: hypothetical protein [Roseovarius]ARE82448.1 hypothetical protein ROSMUCSMR3_00951 [Roseovarius mucosus]AWZ22526.1 Hypothetical protein RAK1035_3821 [Roseovarius sp. AK1035]EDM32256.1 hypothetical protein RTM1035_12408 [Roseovarius sp. TM1035]MBW4972771.1 hypothetical protein [Roseovarius mucosus]VVT25040.1 conserved hypothetical protein [Roseovarius sp. EC-SD190]|tara:strand:- start:3786 stop:4265 length:480 start_codon:yes stop_codon:yes gene_type:complete